MKKQFGERLQSARRDKGVSQADAAAYIGVSTAAYQNYENGRREAGYDVIAKLADYFCVTTDYLLGREKKPDPFGDIGLSQESEKAVIDKYMSLPEETRAVLMDVLMQLSGATQPPSEEKEKHTATCGELEEAQKSVEEVS